MVSVSMYHVKYHVMRQLDGLYGQSNLWQNSSGNIQRAALGCICKVLYVRRCALD